MWNVMGLPMHPLIVHAVVVFVPLTALAAIVLTLWRAGRDRFGVLVLGGAAIALITTFVAKVSGEALYAAKPAHSPQLDAHAGLATPLVWWVLGLVVGIGAWWTAGVLRGRAEPADSKPPQWLTVLHWVGLVLVWVFGVTSIVVLVRAAHAGATSVWG